MAREHPGGARLTERDRQVLCFAAEQRFVLGGHVACLLRTSPGGAARRLRHLAQGRYLLAERWPPGRRAYRISQRGLRAVASPLPAPRPIDLATYDHEVGLAWFWLAAHRGRFGPLRAIISERRMRSSDGRREFDQPFGSRLPGAGRHGAPRRHYPDLLLETGRRERLAVELELTGKEAARRSRIMGAYAFDTRLDAVLYLVEHEATGRAIQQSAAAAGIAPLVHVLPISFAAGSGALRTERTVSPRAGRRPAARQTQAELAR